MNNTLPEEIILSLKEEICNINFGKLILEISIHDKNPKFRIIKEISIIPGKKTSGEQKKGEKNEK